MFKLKKQFTTFICYRRTEKRGNLEMPVGSYIARIIYEYLSQNGIKVCYDIETFKPSEDYKERTSEILEQIRCFILILTPNLLNRCVNKLQDDEDDVYRELMIAISKYQKEQNDTAIPKQNKFRIITINPDSLFDYDKHIPKSIDSQIICRLKSTNVCDIQFCKTDFKNHMQGLLMIIKDTLRDNNLIDMINNKYCEQKQDIINTSLSLQKKFIGRLVEKFLNTFN